MSPHKPKLNFPVAAVVVAMPLPLPGAAQPTTTRVKAAAKARRKKWSGYMKTPFERF
jgi:hypothetical protein